MNPHVQQCNLETFLNDVAGPARSRWHAVQARSSEGWRARWAAGEVWESLELLALGEAIGVFPRNWESPVHGRGIQFFSSLPAVHPIEDHAEAHLLSINFAALEHLEAQPEPRSKRELRAIARAHGLFRSTSLCSAALGHGVAAEALALLTAGKADRLLESMLSATAEATDPLATREQALNALARPDRDLDNDESMNGAVLAASVFHAIEFLYTVGFAHEERELSVYGEETLVDPLQGAIGLSTADLLHRVLFWRLPVTDGLFRVDFLRSVRAAATVLFNLRAIDHRGADEGDATDFAEALVSRVSRAADVWGRAFDSEFRWGSGSIETPVVSSVGGISGAEGTATA